MAGRRGGEELVLMTDVQDEGGRRQVAHPAAGLEPADVEPEFSTVAGERFPEVEGRRREVRGDLVGGDAEVVVLDLPPALGVPHQPEPLTGTGSSQRVEHGSAKLLRGRGHDAAPAGSAIL